MADRILGGRYQIQDKIGTGGMAIVYRGLDQVLGRTVAIKTMLPQYAADDSFAARFKQEAQAAAALQSPYIVSVYDWGRDGDTYFIVMEYLRGTNLKSGIRKHGALDCKKIAQIGSQICQALSVAHAHGIIHRDIKPQNIMVQPDGNVKVMDFGIARAKNSHLTTDNSVLGTAHYVSPEQTQGKDLGPASDLYSLGIVMYEAATGKLPFDGDDAIAVALKQVNEQPLPPSKINPQVDPALEAIILKCMQKNPADRFQSADSLKRTLRDYFKGDFAAVSRACAVPLMGAQQQQGAGQQQGGQQQTSLITQPGGAVAPVPLGGSGGKRSKPERGKTERSKPERDDGKARKDKKDGGGKKGGGSRTGIVVGVIVLLAAIAGIAAYALFGNRLGQPQTQQVPDLVGLTQDEASEAIEGTEFFEVGRVRQEYSDDVAEGLIIEQDPKAKTDAEEGTRIDLVVSKGKEPPSEVEVPDLTNMTPEQAEAALEAAGLRGRRRQDIASEEVEKGKVATQGPAAHSMAVVGSAVDYHVSSGPEDMSVPDVQGKSESSATSALESLGFEVSVSYDYSSSVDSGYVISQSPSGGEKLAKGEIVYIVVSQGEHTATVPDVVGSSVNDAESSLGNSGFDYYVQYAYSDSVASGRVISQSPSGGSTASYGSTVTITVSEGPEVTTPALVTVPGVVGNDEGGAVAMLQDAGFGVNIEHVHDVAPLDQVINQEPAGWAEAEEGSTVTIVVSLGPETP